MRKLLLFAFATIISASLMAQIEGTWKVANEAGAIGVGPGQGDISWWSNSADDLTLRACYFDDEYYFGEDGSFMNMMGDETWLEVWQGVEADGCGAPIAPHDGSNAATWTWNGDDGELTLNGVGAFLGLSKVFNGGELTAPGDAPESITYMVEFSEDNSRITVDIAVAGDGWWRFLLDKVVVETFDVTMNVDMTDAEGFDPATHSVYVSGNVFGWPEPGTNPDLMLTQVEESMIYTITASLTEAQEVQYKFFSDAVAGGWDGGEWTGDPNRVVYITGETTLDDMWGDQPSVVTFMVDMSWAADTVFNVETDEVYMAGTINVPNGWVMPGETENMKMMPVEEGSMMYSLNVTLYNGDYEYKYFTVTDGMPSWDGGEWEGGDNRAITVDTTMAVEDYWGSLTGIFEAPKVATFNVYPNPANSVLNIEEMDNATQVKIFNVVGSLIKTVEVGSQNATIDVSNLNRGVYFVSVYNAEGVQTTKFIKE